ncbi:MAG: gamma-glutamylcyclotransferase [Pseudomonadota bacterium]
MDLFVYGTLRSHALMAAVAGPGVLDPVQARLNSYAVVPLEGNVVPFVRPADGQIAEGLLWRDLSPAQMARLDAYEGAFGYELGPVLVDADGQQLTAQCYLPPPNLIAGEGEWSLSEWEAGHLAPAVLAAKEVFSHNPIPDHASLRRMWPMIEARAWARHRAAVTPAAHRHAPDGDDFVRADARPPQGQFFRFQSVDINHRTFTGDRSDTMTREVFVGVDAAIVLPYDPVRDKVLLVEQARVGPHLRHDPNPWMLEPVAGIIDARETPEGAALRETQEEAGLRDVELIKAGSFYVSPGSTTDYFYTFIGLCDLPQDAPYLGGLPEEGEDLRLHPLPFETALALADTGEIQTGPAVYLIHWLLRHRDRLRAASG